MLHEINENVINSHLKIKFEDIMLSHNQTKKPKTLSRGFRHARKHVRATKSLRSMLVQTSLFVTAISAPLALTSCGVQQIAAEASQMKTRASSVRDRFLFRKVNKKISNGEIASAREDLQGFILPSYRYRAELLLAKEGYKENPQKALEEVNAIEDAIWEIKSPSLRSHALLDLVEFFLAFHRNIPKAKQVLAETEKTILLIQDETLQHRMTALLKLKEKYNHLLIRGSLITQGDSE